VISSLYSYAQNLVKSAEYFLTPTCPKLTRPGCDKLPGCPMAALSSTLSTRHAVIDENSWTSSSPHTHLYSFISNWSTLWKTELTRMWANAQRDGRPAEYRWRPLFNIAKFGWRPLLECRAVTLPRRESRWNLQGCPKLANRSQPLVGRSSPYYEDMWRRYRCLTSFFPIIDTCLSCEDTARQSCAMVPKWRFLASCICSEPRAAHFRHAF